MTVENGHLKDCDPRVTCYIDSSIYMYLLHDKLNMSCLSLSHTHDQSPAVLTPCRHCCISLDSSDCGCYDNYPGFDDYSSLEVPCNQETEDKQ